MWRIESRFEMLAMPLRQDQFKEMLRFYTKAYHYTPTKNVKSILANGIDPKYAGLMANGQPGLVYLFIGGNEPHYLEGPDMSCLEIDLTQLNPELFYPDDDWWETAYDNNAENIYEGRDPIDLDDEYATTEDSVLSGRFAYAGVIPPGAISLDMDLDY